MLEQVLREVIPSKLSSFKKLKQRDDPYYFTSWDKIKDSSIIRYWFWKKTRAGKNNKRVFVNEIEALLRHSQHVHSITRSDYAKWCPKTKSDGPCGFAVIIRIFEHLQVVEVADGDYRVAHQETIQELLA